MSAIEPPDYAELHALSQFSFQHAASGPRELVERAAALGYRALALTDQCSLAGVVRAHEAARRLQFHLIVGSEIALVDGTRLVLLASDHAAYTGLCQRISSARRRSRKGEYRAEWSDLTGLGPGLLCLWAGRAEAAPPLVIDTDPAAAFGFDSALAARLRQTFGGNLWIAVELHRDGQDRQRLAALTALSARLGIRAVAAGDVRMHSRGRRALHDVQTAIRLGCSVAEAGTRLVANGEHCLRSRADLASLYPPELLAESVAIADRCRFSLAELRYQYPHEVVPAGVSASAHLRQLTLAGADRRWPEGMPATVASQIEHELALIAELGYESYFLTVHDIVCFARGRGILCQGRGSAANSAVCFALGITEVDPARGNLLFERFISRERNEPPDIDIDFEHERREEVIQYVYAKYGRERAALTATVICYRPRSALRDVGRALGFASDQIDAMTRAIGHWDGEGEIAARLAERGFDAHSPPLRRLLARVAELIDSPRHLSQHVGGFVISEQPLSTLVPVENAAMPERTVIQWDKDDLDALGLLKVDLLALGMLSCLRRCFDLVAEDSGQRLSLAGIPAEDADTYRMIQAADTVGVFQIESRAQMAMLPRLKPATFYDLVIEVAIVRPGPIQGKMVHPYLRRREQKEPVDYPNPALRQVFERTLGVPIFQEQVMRLAIVAAGFSPGEADQLRRGMAAWKRHGGLEPFRQRIVEGMRERGYDSGFAEQVFEQIKGFGSYGFPESHAASFALLAYASAWLKCHQPAAFACALLNSQPMGFYSPGQIIQDARRHGVQVLPPDVQHSDWDSRLVVIASAASVPAAAAAIRLGLREIRGLRQAAAAGIVAARADGVFGDAQQLAERAGLDRFDLARLAEGGALATLSGHRHQARWQVQGVERGQGLLAGTVIRESAVVFAPPTTAADVMQDYAALGYTLGAHPLALLRPALAARGAACSPRVRAARHGQPVRAVGLVSMRQRPATASGVTFITLEDEHGWLNVIVWAAVYERQRRIVRESRLLAVDGELQQAEGVTHLIAQRLHDWSALLDGLATRSRDFR
ncbi:MAG: error-prone DNA polymerase [Lysobacterales bacterium]